MEIKDFLIEHIQQIECNESLLDLKVSIDYAINAANNNEDLKPFLKLAGFSLVLSEAIKKCFINKALKNETPQL